MDKGTLWNNFLTKIKNEINAIAFETWFKDTKLYEMDNGKMTVLVPMHIHKKHLLENYNDLINTTINDLTGTNFEIDYRIEEELKQKKKTDALDIGVPKFESNLIKKYTFDSFVVGDSNKFAQAAGFSVAENPGKMYNPLFIYGKSGLGKTHLMHAIGNYIREETNKNILYVTSEQFITDFLGINKRDKDGTNFDYIDYFKDKYRNIDVLMIDDIQFLGSATKTQEEFFHTFNQLYDSNKQIIISSDRSPDDLKLLEDRLRTRFAWGLTVNIFPPDLEHRRLILKKKIAGHNLTKEFPDEVVDYIANNCDSDVRQLEGTITRVYAYATMMSGSEINLELTHEALKDYLNKAISYKNNITRIQKIVSDYYKVSIDDLKSKKRNYIVAFPRQIAMYLCRTLTDESYPRIGLEFGGRDHSTVIHSFEKIERELKTNEDLKEVINKLQQELT